MLQFGYSEIKPFKQALHHTIDVPQVLTVAAFL